MNPRRAGGLGALLFFVSLLPLCAQATAVSAPGSAVFREGERLFRENKPREAAAVLERAILENGADERSWLYLAAAYQQLGKYDEGLAALRKGLAKASERKNVFYFNMGNLFMLQGKAAFAEEAYGEALSLNDNYAPAFLNRANARLNLGNYRDAQADYSLYLALEPNSPQRPAIEAVLGKLGTALAAVERKAAEDAARREAEVAARQALLDEIAASLRAAAEETTNLSAGSGSVEGYGDELPLED